MEISDRDEGNVSEGNICAIEHAQKGVDAFQRRLVCRRLLFPIDERSGLKELCDTAFAFTFDMKFMLFWSSEMH